MNKKGQFFSAYLVILTLFMCFLSIYLYSVQNKNIQGDLASPNLILKLEDEKEIFEIQERILLNKSIEETIDEGKWGDTAFIEGVFLNRILDDEQKGFRNFLYEDGIFEGVALSAGIFESDSEQRRNFFDNLYDFEFDENQLNVFRKSIIKIFTLETFGEDVKEIEFKIGVRYNLQNSYSFKQEDFK